MDIELTYWRIDARLDAGTDAILLVVIWPQIDGDEDSTEQVVEQRVWRDANDHTVMLVEQIKFWQFEDLRQQGCRVFDYSPEVPKGLDDDEDMEDDDL